MSTKPGTYKWVQPPPPNTGPRTATTDEDGVATFQWKPSSASAVSTISVSEDLTPGYELVEAVCSVSQPGVTRRRVIRDRTPEETTGTLKPGEFAKCTVRNRIARGTIEIEKEATPESSQAFASPGRSGASR